MINQRIIHWIVEEEDLIVPTLFKPVQFNVIKKLDNGKKLTENEKRYLRGKMKKKITLLQSFMSIEQLKDNYLILLDIIGSYYITGLEALKHNGYGWYFKPKIVEIINTKVEGTVTLNDKTIKFIRIKSIKSSKIVIDKESGLKYATNEQIIKDIAFTKNKYTENVWIQMLARYKNMFVKNIDKFKNILPKQKIDYSKYGV
ncbi:hypothetical protein HYX17_01975 [Candidatus Woesearchaeota archaeon]|nr:hypothetical protein [Candidatus Woesearchaeota archaeon]